MVARTSTRSSRGPRFRTERSRSAIRPSRCCVNSRCATTSLSQAAVDALNASYEAEPQSKAVNVVHEIKRALYEDYSVPAHEPRTASNLYTQTHHDLVYVQDESCFICGIRKSTGGNMETHHWHLEWSLANGADWGTIMAAHPDFPAWDKINAADPATYHQFVDHPYNMLILCDVHHRAKLHGIHAIEYPIWVAQKYMRADFVFIPSPDKALEFVDDLDD